MNVKQERRFVLELDKNDIQFLADTGSSKSLRLDDEEQTEIHVTLSPEAQEEYGDGFYQELEDKLGDSLS